MVMTTKEQDNSETKTDIIEEKQGGALALYRPAGIGLIGGVVGALAVTMLSLIVRQDSITPQLERQAERIEQLKADQEKEFSRVFNALAALNDEKQQFEASLAGLDEAVQQGQHVTDAVVSLNEELAELKNRLTQLEMPISGEERESAFLTSALDRMSVVTDHINTRLNMLENKISEIEQQITILPQLSQRQERQETQIISLMKEQAGSLNRYTSQMGEIVKLQSDVATLLNAPPPASDEVMEMLFAASALKYAIDRSGTYKNELQNFAALAPANLPLDELEKYAETGFPNVAELSRNFTKLADAIAATENVLPEDAGLTDQILHQGSQLYSSRPVGEVEGDTAAAIAARMEVAIGSGDFARALDEAQSLPSEAKAIAADFLEILQAREAAATLLSDLIVTTLQERNRTE